MIAIVDYDAGNLKSVEKAFQAIGQECIVTREPKVILEAEKVVLPGVGSFGDAIQQLHQHQLVAVLKQCIDQGKPFLGICLGLQLLFDSSEETPGVKGLGFLPGKIVRIPDQPGFKIPHIGWNSLEITPNTKLFAGIDNGSYVYFVHSYYLVAEREGDVAAKTDYVTSIHASVEHDNIFACQFHPEKSGRVGLRILENFAKL